MNPAGPCQFVFFKAMKAIIAAISDSEREVDSCIDKNAVSSRIVFIQAGVRDVMPSDAGIPAVVVSDVKGEANAGLRCEIELGSVDGDVVSSAKQSNAEVAIDGPGWFTDEVPFEHQVEASAKGVTSSLEESPEIDFGCKGESINDEVLKADSTILASSQKYPARNHCRGGYYLTGNTSFLPCIRFLLLAAIALAPMYQWCCSFAQRGP